MVKDESESNAGGGGIKVLQVSRDSTCGSFMSQPSDDPTEQQRLISKRWSLKHDQTLETFGMRDQVQQQLTQKPNMMRDITNVPRVQKLTNLPATGSKTVANPPAPDTIPLASADICNSFKKLSKAKNIRKRPTVEEGAEEDAEGESSVVHMKKKAAVASNKLYFSTGPPKCNKAAPFYFESPKEITVQNDSRATASLETETEFSKDARAIRERVLKLAEEALKGKSKSNGDEKLYKGMNQYTDYKAGLRREHTISSEKACGAHGPLRASAYIRVSTRFDYQPDICKDYKETGYCGYGDACKFLHDRGDYKSGWQLEKEWEETAKERKRKLAMGVLDEDDVDAEKSDEDDDDSLPFACFICRQPFVDPVVTKCKHYFCVHCALKHHAKNKKCFVCNQPTLGIFNTAFEICKRMAVQGK